jgi:tetratricopeptide (TPR) repeat protein
MSVDEKVRRRDEARIAEEERRIAEIFAGRVESHINAAERYRSEGRLENALDEVKIALEFDPGNERAAVLLEEIGEEIIATQEERSRSEEKALLINQHFSLGLKYYSNNEYMLARAEWGNVLELDPENEQALDYLSRTREKLREQVEQHRTAAMNHERGGNLTAAIGEWNIVRVIDPDNADAAAAIDRINSRLESMDRDYREANRRLLVVELFQNAAQAFGEGNYEGAADLSRQVLQIQPDHEEAANLLRRAQRRMTPLTEEDMQEIRRLYIEGMKHFTQKDYSEAIKKWDRILVIDPDNESVRKNIEEAQQRLNSLE